jgi:pyridoxine kinase
LFEIMDNKPAVIAISSHVARGSVGNRAAVFALEVLGHNVWAVPTVTLPWHPGHGKATRIVASAEEFSALLEDLGNAQWLSEVGGVLSGYLGDHRQATAIAKLVETIKAKNPDVIYACDPVIGDSNGLYVSEVTAAAIRDILVPIADLITPNRFELAWLCQHSDFASNDEILAAAQKLGRPLTLVTSAISMMRNSTGNILLSGKSALLVEHTMIENPPNGLGDLTSALFLARMLEKLPMDKALQKVTSSVFEILSRAHRRNADELMLETDSGSLVRPMAMVQMRNLLLPKS